jgi:hypothetical protein
MTNEAGTFFIGERHQCSINMVSLMSTIDIQNDDVTPRDPYCEVCGLPIDECQCQVCDDCHAETTREWDERFEEVAGITTHFLNCPRGFVTCSCCDRKWHLRGRNAQRLAGTYVDHAIRVAEFSDFELDDLPVGVLAFYGPSPEKCTKAVATVVDLKKALIVAVFDGPDVQRNQALLNKVFAFFKEHDVAQAVVFEELLGCEHEEGVDFEEGETCPLCPDWKPSVDW